MSVCANRHTAKLRSIPVNQTGTQRSLFAFDCKTDFCTEKNRVLLNAALFYSLAIIIISQILQDMWDIQDNFYHFLIFFKNLPLGAVLDFLSVRRIAFHTLPDTLVILFL